MNSLQFISDPANGAQFWSARVDALERHLSAHRWALKAVTVVVIVYPIARIVVFTMIHGMMPEVVRTVLHLI